MPGPLSAVGDALATNIDPDVEHSAASREAHDATMFVVSCDVQPLRFVSKPPFVRRLLPPGVTHLHTLEAHPPMHACPHVPQLFALLVVSTHRPLQSIWLAGHLQVELTQLVPPVQTCVHMPQLLLSFDVLTQVDVHRVGVDPVHWQLPLRHCWPPLHDIPHVWQLPLSLCKLTHAPLQSLRPMLQASVHEVPLHAGVPSMAPLLGPGHAVVHEVPQLLAVDELSQVPPQLSVPGH